MIVIPPNRVRIKMCGMTRREDVVYATSLGVDALGFIFYSRSKRYVSVDQAKKLLANVSPLITYVAVLVNPDISFVEEIVTTLPNISCLQFHGDETPGFCEQFNMPYIKAIPARSKDYITEQMRRYSTACGVLIDTPGADYFGGTGKAFDWDIVPKESDKPIIVAGGLNAANVQQMIMQVNPYAVDVCSGVETLPGVKEQNKMTDFVVAVNGTGAGR